MFYIDQNTIDYLRLTGREDAQVALVEQYAKKSAFWASEMTKAEYPRVLRFDLSTVTRNIAGPSNPHARVSTADLKEKGIAGVVENRDDGLMPDGAIIISCITSLYQHFLTHVTPWRQVCWHVRQNELGLVRKPWVKSSFAPGSKAAALLP